MQRVHIAQQVHGRQMHNTIYLADRINISVTGDGLATVYATKHTANSTEGVPQ